jgi:hypothetical protein
MSLAIVIERVDVINELGVLVDSRMTFVDHIGSIVSKSARMLRFIKRISKDFNDPYTSVAVCGFCPARFG